jgi:hypothetical protein
MNVSISSSISSNRFEKPPIYPHGSQSFSSLNNKKLDSLTNISSKSKYEFSTSNQSSAPVGPKPNKNVNVNVNLNQISHSLSNKASQRQTKEQPAPAPRSSHVSSFQPFLQTTATRGTVLPTIPEVRHRRTPNSDFSTILPLLEEDEQETSALELPSSATTTNTTDFDPTNTSPRETVASPILHKFTSIDDSIQIVGYEYVHRLHFASQTFYKLLDDPTGEQQSMPTLKRNLQESFESTCETMKGKLHSVVANFGGMVNENSNLHVTLRTALVGIYQRAISCISALVGVLQVFGQHKKNHHHAQPPNLQNPIGVVWSYHGGHTAEQNKCLNLVMRGYLRRNWKAPELSEDEICHLAVKHNLCSVAIDQWLENALLSVWEPVVYADLVPPKYYPKRHVIKKKSAKMERCCPLCGNH